MKNQKLNFDRCFLKTMDFPTQMLSPPSVFVRFGWNFGTKAVNSFRNLVRFQNLKIGKNFFTSLDMKTSLKKICLHIFKFWNCTNFLQLFNAFVPKFQPNRTKTKGGDSICVWKSMVLRKQRSKFNFQFFMFQVKWNYNKRFQLCLFMHMDT